VVQLFEVMANHHLVDTGESRDKSPGDVFA
jgi:hypothetical protein